MPLEGASAPIPSPRIHGLEDEAMKRVGVVFVLIALLAMPAVAAAQYPSGGGGGSSGGGIQIGGGGSPGGDSAQTGMADVSIVDFAFQPMAIFVGVGRRWSGRTPVTSTTPWTPIRRSLNPATSARGCTTVTPSTSPAFSPTTAISTRTCGGWSSLPGCRRSPRLRPREWRMARGFTGLRPGATHPEARTIAMI